MSPILPGPPDNETGTGPPDPVLARVLALEAETRAACAAARVDTTAAALVARFARAVRDVLPLLEGLEWGPSTRALILSAVDVARGLLARFQRIPGTETGRTAFVGYLATLNEWIGSVTDAVADADLRELIALGEGMSTRFARGFEPPRALPPPAAAPPPRLGVASLADGVCAVLGVILRLSPEFAVLLLFGLAAGGAALFVKVTGR